MLVPETSREVNRCVRWLKSHRTHLSRLEQANIALRRRSSDSPPPAGHLWGGDASALNRGAYLDGMAWPHRN